MTIKNKDLAFLSVRLLSIYIFIKAIIELSKIINYSGIANLSTFSELGLELNTAITNLLIAGIAPFVFLLAISIILWVFTNKISKYLLPANTVIEDDGEFNINNVQTMIFSIIGVLIVTLTIPQVFSSIVEIININNFNLSSQYKTEIIFSIIGVAVKLLIGFALIIWSKKLTKFLTKLG